MRLIVSIFALFILMQPAMGQQEKKDLEKGNQLYHGTDYVKAEELYRQALEKKAESKEGLFNLGDALYRQEKYKEAAQEFNKAAQASDDKMEQSQAYHNLGNSLLQDKQFKPSIEAYKKALRLNPRDQDSRYNLAYAKKMLQQQQQQNKDKNKDEDKKDEDKKDKEDKKEDKKDEDKKDDKKEDKEKDKEEEKKDEEDKKKEEDKKDKGDKDDKKDKPDDKEKGQQPPPKVSKQDAQRMLDALNEDDRKLQRKLQVKKGKSTKNKIEKNW